MESENTCPLIPELSAIDLCPVAIVRVAKEHSVDGCMSLCQDPSKAAAADEMGIKTAKVGDLAIEFRGEGEYERISAYAYMTGDGAGFSSISHPEPPEQVRGALVTPDHFSEATVLRVDLPPSLDVATTPGVLSKISMSACDVVLICHTPDEEGVHTATSYEFLPIAFTSVLESLWGALGRKDRPITAFLFGRRLASMLKPGTDGKTVLWSPRQIDLEALSVIAEKMEPAKDIPMVKGFAEAGIQGAEWMFLVGCSACFKIINFFASEVGERLLAEKFGNEFEKVSLSLKEQVVKFTERMAEDNAEEQTPAE